MNALDTTALSHTASQIATRLAQQSLPTHTLYVVATPIGNIADISLRALAVLQHADMVAAEDTRVTGQLLSIYGLHKPLLACDAHREAQTAEHIIAKLHGGARIALVSDAGTPAVSDPGARVVAAVRAAGLRVVPIAGASSVTAAVSASGLVDAAFTFHAFAPQKGAERARFYTALGIATHAQIWFESPHRMGEALKQIAAAAPAHSLCIARELSKQFEEIVVMPAADSPAWFASHADHGRGEFVLVLAPPVRVAIDSAVELDGASAENIAKAQGLGRLLATELPASKAASLAAKHYGVDKAAVYEGLKR